MPARKYLGVTVLPEYAQNEGVERVVENLVKMGANAVATSPYVMEPADETTGLEGRSARHLDQSLWLPQRREDEDRRPGVQAVIAFLISD